MRFLSKLLGTTVLTAAMLGGTCNAAPVNQSNSATITPATQNLQLTANQVTANYVSTIRNTTTQTLRVHVSSRDFTALGSRGQISLLNNNSSASSPHGIASHISVDIPDFEVLPGQSHDVQVSLTKADKLAAGGHYGAVLFDVVPVQSGADTNKNVTFKQTLASLVFVTTQGRGTYDVQTAKPHLSVAWFRLPKTYDLIFRNTGNAQFTPRGYVNMTEPSGKQVAKGTINTDSGIVLPDTNRLISVPLSAVSASLLPGLYTIKTYYRYDGAAQFSIQTQHFFYVSYLLIVLLMLFIVVVIALLVRRSKLNGRLVNRIKT